MKVVESLGAISRPCAFVPTMGALHAGHQSLIQIAREFSTEVIVSVFVNPLQFENQDDLAKYPKTPERDEELADEAGATVLWRPSYEELYPSNYQRLDSGEIGRRFEGASRPGHFDGVLTVVNRLFEIVQPTYAIFGEKDFQQLFLIRQMAAKYHPEIEIVAAPTVRESSGLALSSRNVRLGESGTNAAAVISSALRDAAQHASLDEMKSSFDVLAENADFKLDYAEVIDEDTFELATSETPRKRAIVAGWINGVRLIDNMAMARTMVKI